MGLASLVISLCIHIAIFLLIWFWPAPAALDLSKQPILISLVDGAPGGNRTPSPILGHMGETSDGPMEPAPPAPQSEVAVTAREEIKPEAQPVAPREAPQPQEIAPKPAPAPTPPPEPVAETPKPAPTPKEIPKPREKPKPEPPKPEKPVEKPKPEKKPEPKKPQPAKPAPKKPAPKADPVAAALQQARKATSRASSGDRGNAVEQALAQARRNAGGNRGGGGGEGSGPGGGGLGDVYVGQVMLAVRPNWGFASPARRNLVCVVKVRVDMQGKVQDATISRSSGNAQYDASAVNAIMRTSNAGDFPPPPNASYGDLDLVFTLDEMAGR